MFNYHAEGIYFCWGVEDVIKKTACANGSKKSAGFLRVAVSQLRNGETIYIYILSRYHV